MGASEETKSQSLEQKGIDEQVNPKKVTISSEDIKYLENKTMTSAPKWAKPIKPWDTVYFAGEIKSDESDRNVSASQWEEGALPMHLEMFNFTPLEEGLRRSASISD